MRIAHANTTSCLVLVVVFLPALYHYLLLCLSSFVNTCMLTNSRCYWLRIKHFPRDDTQDLESGPANFWLKIPFAPPRALRDCPRLCFGKTREILSFLSTFVLLLLDIHVFDIWTILIDVQNGFAGNISDWPGVSALRNPWRWLAAPPW